MSWCFLFVFCTDHVQTDQASVKPACRCGLLLLKLNYTHTTWCFWWSREKTLEHTEILSPYLYMRHMGDNKWDRNTFCKVRRLFNWFLSSWGCIFKCHFLLELNVWSTLIPPPHTTSLSVQWGCWYTCQLFSISWPASKTTANKGYFLFSDIWEFSTIVSSCRC